MAVQLPITVACSHVHPGLTHLEVEVGREGKGGWSDAVGRRERGPRETCHNSVPLINPI